MQDKIDKDCNAYFLAQTQKRRFRGSRMDVLDIPTESTVEKEPVLDDTQKELMKQSPRIINTNRAVNVLQMNATDTFTRKFNQISALSRTSYHNEGFNKYFSKPYIGETSDHKCLKNIKNDIERSNTANSFI